MQHGGSHQRRNYCYGMKVLKRVWKCICQNPETSFEGVVFLKQLDNESEIIVVRYPLQPLREPVNMTNKKRTFWIFQIKEVNQINNFLDLLDRRGKPNFIQVMKALTKYLEEYENEQITKKVKRDKDLFLNPELAIVLVSFIGLNKWN